VNEAPPTVADRRLRRLVDAGLLLFVLAWAVGLFGYGPIPATEPRFAEIVREMFARSNFLVPTINGLPYVEYPPLYYWLAALVRATGLPLVAAVRTPGLVAYVLWLLVARRLARSLALPERVVVVLPLVLGALPIALYNFFLAHTDSWLALGVLVAYTGYVRLRRGLVAGFPWELWLGEAVALLAKGPVGLAITLPAMGLDLLWSVGVRRPWSSAWWRSLWAELGPLRPFRGLALALLPITAWACACGVVVGWSFDRATFVYQNFTRYTQGIDHFHGVFFYAHTIWGDFAPWSLLLPWALVVLVRRRHDPAWRILGLWALWTIVFFSLAVSKQSKYLLPAAPALVLLALLALRELPSRLATLVGGVLRGLSVTVLALTALVFVFVLSGLTRPWLTVPTPKTFVGLPRLRAWLRAHPGTLVSYTWPAPPTVYELEPVTGGPFPWVRSARALYRDLHERRFAAGSYLLVPDALVPVDGRILSPLDLSPPPARPWFRTLFTIPAQGGLTLYEILPPALGMKIPRTPRPPARNWLDRFDTD
jgi:4-amino-4-deoxy-L-arabinose transferase-like glycosyltransferase